MIGFGIGMGGRSGRKPYALTSVNKDLADPGGGDSIEINGSGLSSVTAAGWNGVPGTITGNTGTKITLTLPAPGATGLLSVYVSGPGGTVTLPAVLEAWRPATETHCTEQHAFGYTFNLGTTTGLWTAQAGASAGGTPGPPAVGGAPFFDGTGDLTGSTVNSGVHGTAALSHVAVCSFTNTQALVLTGSGGGGPASNPSITECNGQGSLGIKTGRVAGVPTIGFLVNVNGTNCVPTVPAAAGVRHLVVGRFSSATSLVELSVDGSSFTANPGVSSILSGTPGPWSFTGGTMRIGSRYDGARLFLGELIALAFHNVAVDAAYVAKALKWARIHCGVP